MLRVTQRHCKTCGKRTRYERHTYGIAVHVILVLITAGLWLLLLPLMWLFGNKYRCTLCGGK